MDETFIPTICAVCGVLDNVVINKIMASPEDTPPENTKLILVPDGVMCEVGYIWDGENFIDPIPNE